MHAAEHAPSWRPLNVVIAGGGTGGHLFPGIAVANEFARRSYRSRIHFVGAGRSLEKEMVARAGYDHRTIAVEGIKGRGIWPKVRAMVKLPGAVWRSAAILGGVRADLVIGVGGYAAGPVAVAAWIKGIPVVVCEQNTLPGITNRMLFPIARRVYVSFADTRGRIPADKKRVSGNPVRRELLAAAGGARSANDPFTVLVVGGSQGAHAINMAVVAALAQLDPGQPMRFIHQTGADDCTRVAAAYRDAGIDAEVKAFFHDMAARYARADLVVCRAGATTVAELTAMGKAALFIPYPFAADNHQVFNARALVDAGAALMVLEKDLTGDTLARQISALAGSPARLTSMADRAKGLGRPDAARYIVDDCYAMLGDESCI